MSLSSMATISSAFRAPDDFYLTASSPSVSQGEGFNFSSIFSSVIDQGINLGFNVLNAKISSNLAKSTASAAIAYNPVQGTQVSISPASSTSGSSISTSAGIGGSIILILIIGLVIFLIIRK